LLLEIARQRAAAGAGGAFALLTDDGAARALHVPSETGAAVVLAGVPSDAVAEVLTTGATPDLAASASEHGVECASASEVPATPAGQALEARGMHVVEIVAKPGAPSLGEAAHHMAKLAAWLSR
jgi:hypothetical protein